jgi:hypothetical protein
MKIEKLIQLVSNANNVSAHYIHGAWCADYSVRLKDLSDTEEKVCSGTHDELRVDRAFIWYTVYFDRTKIKEIPNKDARRLYKLLRDKFRREELTRDNNKLKKLREIIS